jgi:hypothetical protein
VRLPCIRGRQVGFQAEGTGDLKHLVCALSGTYTLGPGIRLIGGFFYFDDEAETPAGPSASLISATSDTDGGAAPWILPPHSWRNTPPLYRFGNGRVGRPFPLCCPGATVPRKQHKWRKRVLNPDLLHVLMDLFPTAGGCSCETDRPGEEFQGNS